MLLRRRTRFHISCFFKCFSTILYKNYAKCLLNFCIIFAEKHNFICVFRVKFGIKVIDAVYCIIIIIIFFPYIFAIVIYVAYNVRIFPLPNLRTDMILLVQSVLFPRPRVVEVHSYSRHQSKRDLNS